MTKISTERVTIVSVSDRRLRTERFLLLMRQLAGEHGSERKAAQYLGIDPSLAAQIRRNPSRQVGARTMEAIERRLRLDPAYWKDPALGEAPNYREHVGVQDSYVESDPHPAFAELEEEGFIDYARAQGVDEVLLQHERNTPYARGGVDYAEMRRRIESLIIRAGYAARGNELDAAREARERRERAGKPVEKLGPPKRKS